MNARTFVALVACTAWATACGGDRERQGPALPPLPPLSLQPFQPELTKIAESMPAVPDAARRELKELADIALLLVESDERTLGVAQRSLLDHPFAWSVLEPRLQDDQPVAVRRRAAWLCGQCNQPILILPLLLRLKYELDPEGVLWVADALQRLGNDAGLRWIDGGMGVETTAQQAGTMAVDICRERGLAIGELPSYAELQTRMRELSAQWRERGTPSRPDVLAPPADELQPRLAVHLSTTQGTLLRPVDDARFVLTRSGVLAVPLLIRACAADERYLRTMALQVLADLGPCARGAETAVLPLLGDPLTGSYAIRTLGEIGSKDAIPHLRARLTAIDTEERAAVPMALGLLGDRDSAAALRTAMDDPNETMDVRINSAFGLLCLGPDAAAEAFVADREQKADYHAPTLKLLRERLSLARR